MFDFLSKVPVMEEITKTLAILVAALIASALATRVVELILKNIKEELIEHENKEIEEQKEQRATTLTNIVKSALGIGIWSVTTLMIMSTWGIDIAPILTGAGIMGLAVGFGAQQLVRDVVTGFFILFENSYNVGDKVELGGVEGIVEDINVRTTLLKDSEGNIYTFPNSQITKIKKFRTYPRA